MQSPAQTDVDSISVVARPGGSFLLEPAGEARIFTPEDFSDEQRAFYKTAEEFSTQEVVPRAQAIEETGAHKTMKSR